jgi:hypothetical protein
MEEEMDPLMLAMLGVQRGCLVVTLTGRHMSISDFEHIMCKVYMGCGRSRGTRNGGAPKPWRDYCWPSKKGDTVGSPTFENVIRKTIVAAYEIAIDDTRSEQWSMPDLEHPFSDI